MNIRIRLLLMQEIERRNEERIRAFENQRKGASKSGKRKTKGHKGKPWKKP